MAAPIQAWQSKNGNLYLHRVEAEIGDAEEDIRSAAALFIGDGEQLAEDLISDSGFRAKLWEALSAYYVTEKRARE